MAKTADIAINAIPNQHNIALPVTDIMAIPSRITHVAMLDEKFTNGTRRERRRTGAYPVACCTA